VPTSRMPTIDSFRLVALITIYN